MKNGARADEIFAESAPPLFSRLFDMGETDMGALYSTASHRRKTCHHASFVDPSLPHLSLARAPTCTYVSPRSGNWPRQNKFFYTILEIHSLNIYNHSTTTSDRLRLRVVRRYAVLWWRAKGGALYGAFPFPLCALRPQRGVVDTTT
jgi:hypothetical protein